MAAAGDLERMRRRHIKHLIILGADEGRLPAPGPEGGVFSADEPAPLPSWASSWTPGTPSSGEEYTIIYNSVTLPSETLTITSPLFASDGSAREPGLLMRRAAGLFGLKITPVTAPGRCSRARTPPSTSPPRPWPGTIPRRRRPRCGISAAPTPGGSSAYAPPRP